MKSNTEKPTSAEVLKARERNRIAAKKRRLKDRLMEIEKQSEYESVCQENELLKQKFEFLTRLKDLMNNTIHYYQELNAAQNQCTIDESSLANLLDLESAQLYNLSLDIIDKILPDEAQEPASAKQDDSLNFSDCQMPESF
ncbi:hypothetical protein BpHYR1_022946 [Brachionus plicatilis]|uniref:BZIP domain-containing protein n=1 Tax=Brachionus plicatilis TaxID=10195 RepID=A0A3M7RAG9_BRAPC|nr:hypothetical protein BpHYR1_022946 [Brachionus plicatilis]